MFLKSKRKDVKIVERNFLQLLNKKYIAGGSLEDGRAKERNIRNGTSVR